MYSNFKGQAIEYVKQAVEEDNAGNYGRAFPLYMNALEYFRIHLKYEHNPKTREAISLKFTEYLRRAEEIRALLDDGGPGPKPKPNHAGEATTAFDRKPPFFLTQGTEYVKQAVEEDIYMNYAKALPLYMSALDNFQTHLKYEDNPKMKHSLAQKISEYVRRADEIRAVLEETQYGLSSTNIQGNDSAEVERPTTK